MTITVRIGQDVRPSAAIAHRNALLTLAADFRIVDGEADVLVSERPTVLDDQTRVVVGAPNVDDPSSWWADSVVDWDSGAVAFAAAVNERVDQLHALSITVQGAIGDGIGLEDVLADGRRLAAAAVPESTEAPRTTASAPRVLNEVLEVHGIRISLTAVLLVSPTVAVSAKAVGSGFLATLTVPERGVARASMFEIATKDGALRPAMPYSSAARALWLRLAATV